MKNRNYKLYISITILALAVLTTLPQFIETVKGLVIYVPYFLLLCTPAVILFRNKMRELHTQSQELSVQ